MTRLLFILFVTASVGCGASNSREPASSTPPAAAAETPATPTAAQPAEPAPAPTTAAAPPTIGSCAGGMLWNGVSFPEACMVMPQSRMDVRAAAPMQAICFETAAAACACEGCSEDVCTILESYPGQAVCPNP